MQDYTELPLPLPLTDILKHQRIISLQCQHQEQVEEVSNQI